ncbi:phosphotransferase [Ornithinimicrobium faecis]|uniref:phosphotransferase n=1 Tax=Ornithinimicrobium faecis TaxID=2934158 RepID=UPI0021194603|nr:phosphotransferase [Ornithinimicrobium sp. HY1745]
MSESTEPIRSHGVRITWDDLPERVRAWVTQELGEVTEVAPQQGGFSPGTADRVHGTRGSAFVKAVGESLNARTPDLVAREIAVLDHLPPYAAAPLLLSSLDERIEGERWVALLVEDIPGRHPQTPWVGPELDATLEALSSLVSEPLARTIELPRLEEDMAGDLSCWPHLAADPPDDLDPWVCDNLDRLAAVAADAPGRLRGDHLVHTDIRADNLLVTGAGSSPGTAGSRPDTGRVRVVDWPFASRGAPWFDTLTLLLNVRLLGGPDPTAYEGRLTDRGATREDIDAVLVALCGYFLHASRLVPPTGLPTLRAFQRAHAVASLAWVRERLDP